MIKHDLWCFMVQVLLMVLHGTSFTYGASWYKFCSIKSINSYVFCERYFLRPYYSYLGTLYSKCQHLFIQTKASFNTHNRDCLV